MPPNTNGTHVLEFDCEASSQALGETELAVATGGNVLVGEDEFEDVAGVANDAFADTL